MARGRAVREARHPEDDRAGLAAEALQQRGRSADDRRGGRAVQERRAEMRLRVVIAIAITAAAVRLIPLQWLHPLNWDELEYFVASKWIGEGRVPFRVFWDHPTLLVWFVFALLAASVESPVVNA